MKRILPLLLLAVLLALPARAAEADSTGLVPTLWWDLETQPSSSGLPGANKGSASGFTFTGEGTATYVAGATNGWALDASKFTPYSSKNNLFSTAGGAFTLSLVMNLGSAQGGIALNLRNETGAKDLIVRRGSAAGALVVGLGPQASASTVLLETTFADGGFGLAPRHRRLQGHRDGPLRGRHPGGFHGERHAVERLGRCQPPPVRIAPGRPPGQRG